jgi:superfamily II DNA/RNA helicase
MSFIQLNLNSNISKAIQACGYTDPTPIQLRSIPDIIKGRDMVACAQTGTGKTAAFVLPALHLLSEPRPGTKPRVLILTPTRELATQIMDAVGKYGKFMQINMVSLVGGMPYKQQLRGLSRAVDIIVATPGRLLDHMKNRRLDLSTIQMLILDEADRMLDMGFIDDVNLIAKATPVSRQTLLFSATVDNKLNTVVKQLLQEPVRIDLSNENISPLKIKQAIYIADNPQHKAQLLQHFINDGNMFKAIIFSATKVNADKITKQLRAQGHSAAALHGDLKQNVRNRTIDEMRRGKIQFLIATDVASRGIDITDISHVINYDLPKFHEDYVHRIGRTGRAGKSGIAISFALPEDGRNLQGIERFIGQKIELSTVAGLEATKSFNFSATKQKRGRGKPNFKAGGFKSNSTKSYKGTKREGTRDGNPRVSYAASDTTHRSSSKRSNSFRGDNPESRSNTRSDSFKDDSRRSRSSARIDYRDSSPRARSSARIDYKDSNPRERSSARIDYKDSNPRERSSARSDYRDSAPRERSSTRSDYRDNAPRERSSARTDSFKGDSPRSRSSFREDKDPSRRSGARSDNSRKSSLQNAGRKSDEHKNYSSKSNYSRQDDVKKGAFKKKKEEKVEK